MKPNFISGSDPEKLYRKAAGAATLPKSLLNLETTYNKTCVTFLLG
jgi:hypothetical protein